MEQKQTEFFPKGQPTEAFDSKSHGPFQSDLYNLALDKDVAKTRNKWYLAIVALCVLAMVYISTTANYKTYVVRVDNATGQVEAGGELKATNYSPHEAEVKHFLSQFILDTRTVPLDPVQFKLSDERSKHFLTSEAAQKMNSILGKDNPTAKLGHMTVQPQIRSIQLQPGKKDTYQVRWVEDEYSFAGTATGKKVNYVALFSIGFEPQGSKEDELLINPLGFKIKDLTFSKELESKE